MQLPLAASSETRQFVELKEERAKGKSEKESHYRSARSRLTYLSNVFLLADRMLRILRTSRCNMVG